MNRKGEVSIGILVSTAIILIVGAILLTASAQNISFVRNTIDAQNESVGTQASTGGVVYLTQYKSLTGVIFYNATGGGTIPATNYTVTNNVLDPATGAESVNITFATINNAEDSIWTFDATAQTPSYDSSSGGRAIAGLIILLFALTLGVIAMYPSLKSGVLDFK